MLCTLSKRSGRDPFVDELVLHVLCFVPFAKDGQQLSEVLHRGVEVNVAVVSQSALLSSRAIGGVRGSRVVKIIVSGPSQSSHICHRHTLSLVQAPAQPERLPQDFLRGPSSLR